MLSRRMPLIVGNIMVFMILLGVLLALAQAGRFASASASPASLNCTFTLGYWKTHREVWPVTTLTIGGVTYSQQQLLTILGAQPKGDASYILIHQLIAAKLNIANGADGAAVAQIITSADAFLAAHPLGSALSKSDRGTAISLADTLDRYNKGKIGPGACTPNTPTNTPTDTPTNTPVSPTNTPTDTPTNTPVAPTNTPTNTPTDTPTGTPTNTPTDTPTDTPVAPTNTPTDTPTSTPTPTP